MEREKNINGLIRDVKRQGNVERQYGRDVGDGSQATCETYSSKE